MNQDRLGSAEPLCNFFGDVPPSGRFNTARFWCIACKQPDVVSDRRAEAKINLQPKRIAVDDFQKFRTADEIVTGKFHGISHR